MIILSEIGRAIKAVRRAVRVRERTEPVGTVRYHCQQCGMSIKVVLARGVSLPSNHGIDDLRAPAPGIAQCEFCDGQIELDESTYEQPPELELTAPYLRVPSRRAGAEMAARGVVEAQLVRNEP